MYKELPEYVFENKYDNFYLLTEFDIIFNELFTKKFSVFLEKVGYEDLAIKPEHTLAFQNSVKISNPNQLGKCYDIQISNDGKTMPLFMMNFVINDNLKLWEIYVSLENELSIIGCDKEISSLLEIIINPYEEESLEQKYKIISDKFNNIKSKSNFLNLLQKNYHFR